MPQFRYRARGLPGEVREGVVTADSRSGAVARLVRQGYVPFAVKEERPARPLRERLGRVRIKDVALFTRQMSDLLSSGMTLSDALGLLASAQWAEGRLRHLIEAIHRRVVRDGQALSGAAADFPKVFSPFYTAAVRSGEMGGFLEDVLLRLAEVLEKQDAVRSNVRRALAYPLFMSGVGLITLTVLFLFVVPTLAALFEDLGQTLPLPTRLLIGVGDAVRGYGWILPLTLAGAVLGLKGARRSPALACRMDRLMLGLPWVGGAIRKIESARFLMILGALLTADVPVTEAIRAAQESLRNRALKAEVDGIYEDVRAGKSVGNSFRERPLFPPLLGDMMAAGEESNRLGEAMERLARSYDREMDRAVGLITALLEPALIVLLGGVVAFIVAAILLPIFQADFAAY
ncbi:MAG: hypothetical protein A3F84_06395 [Candidatus Handelsmanbacteria bacterium RIFCSPLOWO2_12_FULL_64_10]|uniref:Type II secretion system protein GspF domain-containing protein n=1 Tax=Handelsmanbacteria sp. (strain RIFCSPLOWO2_12_FULL_64_10) TaxID=1817868 RepID=A0A1F6CQV4_HANXR|nr:MAG: hypothetical protein A3F84_06395 [Candidatus Handelsmanbacteria bacterium RIFCSPLOWO2_12_FULL_64_10]